MLSSRPWQMRSRAWRANVCLKYHDADIGGDEWASRPGQPLYNHPASQAKVYPLAPADLLARVKRVALAEPDTKELPGAPDRERGARFVQYTRLMRYPDTTDVDIIPAGEGRATLALYSRSLVGRKDFGVNCARLTRWLAAVG